MIRESVLADEGGEQMNAPFAENFKKEDGTC